LSPVLVDSNVLIDSLTHDPAWGEWSSRQLGQLLNQTVVVINPLIYAEVSIGYDTVEAVEDALPPQLYRRDELPFEAAFLAGKAFRAYRRRGGVRLAPLPDFYIGAHAAVAGYQLLTRDSTRYRTYFPTVDLIAPPQ
jgi:predicted nucleic acid-binding protein